MGDIQTNTDLTSRIHKIFKDYYNECLEGTADLYCLDVPDKIFKELSKVKLDKEINDEFVKTFENYIDELQLYEDIKNTRRR